MESNNLLEIYHREGRSNHFMREVMHRTRGRLFYLLVKMLGDHDVAKEVLQKSYIKVFERMNQFTWTSSIETWVYRIAVNTALDEMRRKKRENERQRQVAFPLEDQQEVDYEGALKVMNQGLSVLPERQREVFIMRYYGDLSFEQIAGKLNLSEGGVRSSYHLAKARLKEVLKEKGWIS